MGIDDIRIELYSGRKRLSEKAESAVALISELAKDKTEQRSSLKESDDLIRIPRHFYHMHNMIAAETGISFEPNGATIGENGITFLLEIASLSERDCLNINTLLCSKMVRKFLFDQECKGLLVESLTAYFETVFNAVVIHNLTSINYNNDEDIKMMTSIKEKLFNNIKNFVDSEKIDSFESWLVGEIKPSFKIIVDEDLKENISRFSLIFSMTIAKFNRNNNLNGGIYDLYIADNPLRKIVFVVTAFLGHVFKNSVLFR